jgi:hypothetical protein
MESRHERVEIDIEITANLYCGGAAAARHPPRGMHERAREIKAVNAGHGVLR